MKHWKLKIINNIGIFYTCTLIMMHRIFTLKIFKPMNIMNKLCANAFLFTSKENNLIL